MRYRYNRPILADGFCFRQWGCLDVRRVTSGRCGNKRSCVIYLFLYSFFFSYSLSFTHYFFLLNQFLFDVMKLCLLTKKSLISLTYLISLKSWIFLNWKKTFKAEKFLESKDIENFNNNVIEIHFIKRSPRTPL